MSIRQFEPRRAVEIIAPRYGSGYRIGGRLILTAAHLLGEEETDCEVRDKRSFGQQTAQIVYRREDTSNGIDIALVELPEVVAMVSPVTLGQLPDITAGEKLAFQMYGYPRWARTQRDYGSAAGGRQIDGLIYPADYSPDDWLVLEAQRLPPEATTAESEWVGASGAAIVCEGVVIAVQRQHQNPHRPASLEASRLWKVYADEPWRQLLKVHGISTNPLSRRGESSSSAEPVRRRGKLRLSGAQREQLQEALKMAFPEPSQLGRMLESKLDLPLNEFAGAGPYPDMLFNLVKAVNARGWVEELLSKALEASDFNPELEELADLWLKE